jgi:aspartate-semialdehyde dehydrogenase
MTSLRRVLVALALGAAQAFVRPAHRFAVSRRAAMPALRMSLAGTTPLKVAIVGATGAVGQEIIGVLEKRGFPVAGSPTLFGSKGGKTVQTGQWGALTTEAFSVEATKGYDVVFLAASGDFAIKYAREIGAGLSENGVVVDNSSALRYDDDVPLVVPEVNGQLCKGAKVVANPNCTTAIALMALYPLFLAFGLKKVIVSTYQAASGAGAAGMAELKAGIANAVQKDSTNLEEDGRFGATPIANSEFAHPLAFNVIPHIDKFQANGYTKEEMKVTWECRKVLGFSPIPSDQDTGLEPKISCTAVRIPTLRAHSEAITIKTEKPVTVEAARAALTGFPGLAIADDTANNLYPMPITSTGNYDVEVGRIRQSEVFENGLDFFICGDQLLRGAALNAVLVAEKARSFV